MSHYFLDIQYLSSAWLVSGCVASSSLASRKKGQTSHKSVHKLRKVAWYPFSILKSSIKVNNLTSQVEYHMQELHCINLEIILSLYIQLSSLIKIIIKLYLLFSLISYSLWYLYKLVIQKWHVQGDLGQLICLKRVEISGLKARKQSQMGFFPKRPILLHTCEHVLSYHLI